jgi:chemotaxis signal transduction protein
MGATTRAFVRFRSSGRSWAVPVEAVREVRPASALVGLPAPRPQVAGVVVVEGGTAPVLSVLGAPAAPPAHVLVCEDAERRTVGLLVEQVLGLVRVPAEAVTAVGTAEEGPGSAVDAYVVGMLHVEDDAVLVLDVGEIGGGGG